MALPPSQFDVVVVGGRVAGAALAARLARDGMTVLVLDKSSFATRPEVPSCPIMYAAAMAQLDELGFTEDKYAHATTRIEDGIIAFEGHFSANLRMPSSHGRAYLYGLDRALFDAALWQHLQSFPTVTCRESLAVTDVIREAATVTGVVASNGERFLARYCVVAADGRHSFLARKLNAKVIEDQARYTSTIHFAEWENVAPALASGKPTLHIVNTGRGENALFFPSAAGRINVAIQIRSDRADIAGDAEAYYQRHLDAIPTVRARLKHARRVGPLLGVRRIANRYREAGGAGWVLVGDALYHKDPLDGQGIYDALVSGRILSQLLGQVRAGTLSWTALLARYRAEVHEATHPMFEQTMSRLERDLYDDPSPRKIDTVMRWALTDPVYQRQFLLFLARGIAPQKFRTPRLLAGVIARGLMRDLRAGLRDRLGGAA